MNTGKKFNLIICLMIFFLSWFLFLLLMFLKLNSEQLAPKMVNGSAHSRKMLQAMIAGFPQETDTKTRLLAMLAAAPQDDEQLTQEELAAINQSRASISRGEGITLDELKKELDS